MKIKGITVTTHFPKSDPKCYGDYYDVDIVVRADEKLEFGMQYGDHYHDKGHDKAAGFVDAIHTLFGSKVPVIKRNIADREDF
jgi:hypothetical protein